MAVDAVDSSPESFHDANETIISPSDPPTFGATIRRVNPNLNAMIDAIDGNDSGDSPALSPLQRRQLFSSPNNDTNDDNPSGTSQYLIRHSAPGQQASLNMSDVLEEQEEGGDGDSVDDAIECDELDQCLGESIRDRLQCLVKDEGPEVSDCDANACLLKKGLPLEVSMPTVPTEWEPLN